MPAPTEEHNLTTPANQQSAVLRPGPTAGPPLLPVESREQLVYLLTQACELEQGVVCEYLFALCSLRPDPEDGLSDQQLAQVARWGQTLSEVAVQEMLHLALASNLLTAVGAVPHLHRPNFPIRCQWYPPDVRLALAPFGEAALRHVMYLERPDSINLQDPRSLRGLLRVPAADRDLRHAPGRSAGLPRRRPPVSQHRTRLCAAGRALRRGGRVHRPDPSAGDPRVVRLAGVGSGHSAAPGCARPVPGSDPAVEASTAGCGVVGTDPARGGLGPVTGIPKSFRGF